MIALFIIKSGFEMIGEAVNSVMGARVSGNLSKAVKATVAEEPGVMGAYDLFLNDYGPGNYYGSVHVEVPETMTADEIDHMSHHIQERVLKKHGIVITTVGVYAYNTTNAEAIDMRETVRKLVMAHKGVIQMHGFYANHAEKHIHFDVIISFNIHDRESLRQHIVEDGAETLSRLERVHQSRYRHERLTGQKWLGKKCSYSSCFKSTFACLQES